MPVDRDPDPRPLALTERLHNLRGNFQTPHGLRRLDVGSELHDLHATLRASGPYSPDSRPSRSYALWVVVVCPACGQENPEGFRFCGACGIPLEETAPAREERKVITALFCDLVGSTVQGEKLDPEDLQALLSRYHARVRAEL